MAVGDGTMRPSLKRVADAKLGLSPHGVFATPWPNQSLEPEFCQ